MEAARTSALERLADELDSGLSDEQCQAIGFPTAEVAARLLSAIAPSMRIGPAALA